MSRARAPKHLNLRIGVLRGEEEKRRQTREGSSRLGSLNQKPEEERLEGPPKVLRRGQEEDWKRATVFGYREVTGDLWVTIFSRANSLGVGGVGRSTKKGIGELCHEVKEKQDSV